MTTPAAASLCGAATVFVVQDVLRAVEHYRDVLGFHTEFTYGEPTFYAGVERDGVDIHLQATSKTHRQPGHGTVNVFVTDVDALYQELKSRRARTNRRTTHMACETSTSMILTAISYAPGWSRSDLIWFRPKSGERSTEARVLSSDYVSTNRLASASLVQSECHRVRSRASWRRARSLSCTIRIPSHSVSAVSFCQSRSLPEIIARSL